MARKVDVPHGSVLWQLLDYAWLPQTKTSPDIRSSLADLLPGTIAQPQRVAGSTTSDAADSAAPFSASSVLPPTYARMLGGDMGDILSETMGSNNFQAFGQMAFPNTSSAIF